MCYPDLSTLEFETLVFPPHLTPQDYTCDHLLYRIKDIFKLPQHGNDTSLNFNSSENPLASEDASSPLSTLQVGALARVVHVGGTQGALLRCTSTVMESSLDLDWEICGTVAQASSPPTQYFELLPSMEVLVLQLNSVLDEPNAFVRVPLQDKFPQCQGQEGFVESKHLATLPALPPCHSAAVCLMRSVQRVALRVRTYHYHHIEASSS
jgi:hypothetical protein